MIIRVATPMYHGAEETRPEIQYLKLRDAGRPHFDVQTATGTYIEANRNFLINHGQSQLKRQKITGFDYILFCDLDIRFNVQHIIKLLSYHKDIVGGAYQSRESGQYVEAGIFVHGIPGQIQHKFSINQMGLRLVDYVGAGFLLVKREVFEAVEYPWFRRPLLEIGGSAENMGEDIAFCVQARKAGFRIWCDFDLNIQHEV